jgi:ATP-dependent RNA helicase RhlE
MSFRELGLAEPLLRAIDAEGYATPTPIQSASIPHLLAGRDLLGTAQTGTGKTAAFALPILHRLLTNTPPQTKRPVVRALVLSPTRELASQIADSFHVYGRGTHLRLTTIFGGVGQGPQVRALRDGIDILVATPGRLLDLIDQELIDLRHVEILVLDEADRMLDMGFLPNVRHIVRALPTERQTILLSATMPQPIAELADSLLDNPARVRIAPVAATTKLIEQTVCFVETKQKPRVLAKFFKTRSIDRALVFTRTKHGADRVVRDLAKSGIRATAIHGNKSQANRQRALANFKSRHTPILIATDIAARGIDVEGISHVLNYDLPHEPETYVHRIGRTGRAGASGVAVSFCDQAERKLLKAIERLTRTALPIEKSVSPDDQADSPAADGSANQSQDGVAQIVRRVLPQGGTSQSGRPQRPNGERPQGSGSGKRRRPRFRRGQARQPFQGNGGQNSAGGRRRRRNHVRSAS